MNSTDPERIVAGLNRAPGTVQVKRPVVYAGLCGAFTFLALMLWFVVSHAGAIMNPAEASVIKPGTVTSAVPANPADLGVPQRSDAIDGATTPAPNMQPTLSPQDLAGAPMPQPPPIQQAPAPVTNQPAPYEQNVPRQPSRAEQLAAANAAAADSDLKVRLDDTDRSTASSPGLHDTPAGNSSATQPDQPPISPYVLERGMVIPATLFTSIDSTIAGTVVAYVNQDVYDAQHQVVVVPRGARITGSFANGAVQGQRRLSVSWDAIKLPNGHTIELDSMPGVDLSGTSGFGAAVDNHMREMFSHVVLLSVLGAGAQLSQPQISSSCGSGYCAPSIGQSIAGSVGTQIAQAGNAIVQRDANIAPTLHVVEGAQVAIMVEHDLPLRPWSDNLLMLATVALGTLMAACAPNVSPDTLSAIVGVESGGNPLALHDNTTARSYAPPDKQRAVAIADALISRGHSVDVGLAQINSVNFVRLHVTTKQILEPCANLHTAATILASDFASAYALSGSPDRALWGAISAYNTGSIFAGQSYVNAVVARARQTTSVPTINLLIDSDNIANVPVSSSTQKKATSAPKETNVQTPNDSPIDANISSSSMMRTLGIIDHRR